MSHLHISQPRRLHTPVGSISLARIVAVVLAGFVAMGLLLQAISPARAAMLDVCASGCMYSDIQTAVNAAAPHDTVDIKPGVYSVGQILISKPLTITGAGEGQTIIDGGLANGGFSSDGMIRVHTSRDGPISISNLTVQNYSRKSATSIRAGIMVRSNATAPFPTTYPVSLSNIEAIGTGATDSATDYGIYFAGIANLPEPTATLDNVQVSGSRGNGVLFEDWRNDITIQNSTLHEGPFGSTALFIGHGVPVNGPNPGKITISGNSFVGRGISLSQTAPGRLNGGFNEVEIVNNHITGINGTEVAINVQAPALAGAGQSVGSLRIEDNLIQGDGFSPADTSHNTTGIRLAGAIDTALISRNEILGVNTAIRSMDNASGSPTHVTVANNRLAANDTGIENLSGEEITAPANWWGCSQDPHNSTSACAVVAESPGLVVIPTWVVRTADLPATVVPGETYNIPVYFTTLSDGLPANLPPSSTTITSFPVTIPADAPDGLIEVATDAIPLDLREWFGESFTLTVQREPVDPAPPTPTNPDPDPEPLPDVPRAPSGVAPVIPLAPNTGFQRQAAK